MAVCYYYGQGLQKDWREASKWFEKSAKQGNARAQAFLGRSYLYGHGVNEDDAQAVYWLQQGVAQGDDVAQYELGICYQYGYGVESSQKSAWELFQKSAEQGNDDAQCKAGEFCYFGIAEVSDPTLAVEWFEKSANQDNSLAQTWVGKCLYFGYGAEQDWAAAKEWFEKASENGDETAAWWIDLINHTNQDLLNPVLLNSHRQARMSAFAHLLANQPSISSSDNWSYYPKINEKLKIKLLQNIDDRINPEEVFCVGDTTLFGSMKNGIVFTMHGVYIRPMVGKAFYFNYADIDRWQVRPNETQSEDMSKAKLALAFRDNTEHIISDVFYYKDLLANAIECLRCADSAWNFTTGHRKSGIVTEGPLAMHEVVLTSGAAAMGGAIGFAAAKSIFGMKAKTRAKYRVIGMQSAYEMASDEYEEKLLRQAEAFKKDKALLTKDIVGYRELLKSYETYITALEATHDEAKAPLIQRLQAECNELKALEASIDES